MMIIHLFICLASAASFHSSFKSPNRLESELENALKYEWDAELNFVIWTRANACLSPRIATMAKDFFFKFTDLGDLRPLKHLLNNPSEQLFGNPSYSDLQWDLIAGYLAKYRLNQISGVDEEVWREVASLDSQLFDNRAVVKALAILLTDQPNKAINPIYAAQAYWEFTGRNDVILKAVFSRATAEDEKTYFVGKTTTSLETCLVMRDLFKLCSFDFYAKIGHWADHHKQLFLLVDQKEPSPLLLTRCFDGFRNEKVNDLSWQSATSFAFIDEHFKYFLNMIHDRWPAWTIKYFKNLPYDYALILAWHVPKLTGFVLLPSEMPNNLVPTNIPYSWEGKAEYFDVLMGNYGEVFHRQYQL